MLNEKQFLIKVSSINEAIDVNDITSEDLQANLEEMSGELLNFEVNEFVQTERKEY